MKKLSFLGFFFGFLLLALDLSAAPITYKQAALYAAQHFQTVAPLRDNVAPSLLYTSSGVPSRGSNDGKDYYVFGKPAGTGFVIVAGDDALPTILAYSDEGNFPVNDLPPHIASYLEGYSLWVAQARARGVQYTAHNTQYTTAIQPLLRGIVWNQGYPYNLFTPEIDGSHALVGCVATATAQIMRYFSWPPRGEGTVEGYPEFGSKQYDWENMPDDARYASRIEQEAVAHLSNEVGRAVKMRYGVAGSAAYIQDAYSALLTHFDYASSLQFLDRTSYADEAWQQLLLDELMASRPIFYCGYNRENENGHAFVLDGHDGNGYYHVNWGWGGACNGYFQLNQLKPDAHYDFSYYQWAIVGFCPSNELNGYYELSVTSSGNGNVDVLPSNGEVLRETEVKFLVTPEEGYSLKRVKVVKTEDGTTEIPFTTEDTKNYSFQMPACPVTICVEFEKTPTYQLTVAPTENGTVSVWPEGSELEENTMVSLFLTPSDNCHLSTLKVVKTDDPTTEVTIGEMADRYFFYMPAYAVTVKAEFEINKPKYPVSYEVFGNGRIVLTHTEAEEGTQVELTVTSSEGHHLGRIKVYKTGDPSTELGLTGDGSKYTFLMPAYPVTVRVEFTPNKLKYPLTLEQEGRGVLDATPFGKVLEGTQVELTVTPSEGHHLGRIKVYKTGDPSTELGLTGDGAKYTFLMPAYPVTVRVEFNPNKLKYPLTLEQEGRGVLDATPFGKVLEDTQVELTVTPSEGHHLGRIKVYKTGDPSTELGLTGDGAKYTFLMPAYPVTVRVEFTPNKLKYPLTLEQEGRGVLDATPFGKVLEGTQVELTVTPSEGHHLGRIKVYKTGDPSTELALTGDGAKYTFLMPAYPVTVHVEFTPNKLKYPLTLEQEGRGVLDATPFGKVLKGTQVELTVTPSEGYHLGRIKVYKTGDPSTELGLTGDGAKYTFLMPAYPVTVHVEFEKDEKPQPPISGKYQLTLAPSEHGSVSASPSGEMDAWTWVSLTVTPESGYHLANLKLFKTGDEATVVGYFSGSGQYSFQMPTHPLTVKAEFEIGDQPPQPQKAYHLSFESYEHGTLAASHVGDIPEFSIVTVTATPDDGYHLANFYVCLTERPNARLLDVRQQGNQYTFLMGCDLTVYAVFEADTKPPVPELEHYSIEVTPPLHGKVFIYSVSQKVNEQIAIEVEPEDGYEFLRLELFQKGELERKMLFESKDMIPLVTARKEGFVFNMPAYDVTIRATFVPKNNSGTPVYESPNLEVTCSPNPCSDLLRLENRGGEPLSYRVFSVAGALLRAGEVPTGECLIDLSSLPEGLYLVHCTTPFGSQKTFKVVKQ